MVSFTREQIVTVINFTARSLEAPPLVGVIFTAMR